MATIQDDINGFISKAQYKIALLGEVWRENESNQKDSACEISLIQELMAGISLVCKDDCKPTDNEIYSAIHYLDRKANLTELPLTTCIMGCEDNTIIAGNGFPGTPGASGVDGLSAYEIWVSQGNVGTEQDFLDSLEGDVGPSGSNGSDGTSGWSPIIALTEFDNGQIMQVTSWTGGTGTAPISGVYIGVSGFVTTPNDAIKLSGRAGTSGTPGTPGSTGTDGWSPIYAIVTGPNGQVFQVTGWSGGTGTPPSSGVYLGDTGFVSDINDATVITGATGGGSDNITFVLNGNILELTDGAGLLPVDLTPILGAGSDNITFVLNGNILELTDGAGLLTADLTPILGGGSGSDNITFVLNGTDLELTDGAGLLTVGIEPGVLATLLTGLSITGGAVVAGDDILAAIGKLQNQLNGKVSGSGTVGTLPVFTSSAVIGDSIFKQDNATLAFVIGEGSVIHDDESTIIGKNNNTTTGTKGAGYMLVGYNNGTGTNNIGDLAVNVGANNETTEVNTLAFGSGNLSSGPNGICMGTNCSATQVFSIASGYDASSTGVESTTYGYSSSSSSAGASSFGARNNSSGSESLTAGESCVASGMWAIALGSAALAQAESAIAMSRGARVDGNYGIAMGQSSRALQIEQLSFGLQAGDGTGGLRALSMGPQANRGSVIGSYSMAFGYQALSKSLGNITMGRGAGRSDGTHGDFNITLGYNANNQIGSNVGADSLAFGRETLSTALESGAFGNSVESIANGAFSMGHDFTNSTVDSMMFGWGSESWRFTATGLKAAGLANYVDNATAISVGGLIVGEDFYIETATGIMKRVI